MYKARRPFHPRRLFSLIHDKFIVLQNVETQGDDENEEEDNGNEAEDEEENEEDDDVEMEDFSQLDPQEILSNRRSHPVLRPILRSKGFFWLATRPYQFGEWSQAGGMLTIGCGGPWFAEVPDEAWPEDADVRKSIEDDFQGPWGDRRQEIVFIGEGIETGAITDLLNECLLNDREMKVWEGIMKKNRLSKEERQEKMMQTWEDGWEEWPSLEEEDEPEQEKGKHRISEHLGHGHSHNHNHSHRMGIKA